MNDVTRAVSEASMSSTERPSRRADEHRGRLFRKYLLLILTLVTIALLASGAISIYFTYQEAKSSLADLQHEKALGAASRIEQYMHQVERQVAYAALPQLDPGDVELRRVEFLKLLRQAPEVTDIAQLDFSGHERLAVSRLGMDSVGSNRDRAQEPAFKESKPDRTWFGPVYFRKETEPYMTIAVRAGGDRGAVTVADVNLKFIWDVVSRIRIGEKGKAYVVDEGGYLVADPDIGLVLRKTNLSALAHVKAAMTAPGEGGNLAMVSTDLAGKRVLTSMAPIASLKWNVFVEQPVSEVYAKLNASILRTALLLLAGLMLSALGALALARGMVRPIRTLEEGAQRIGTGDLDQRIVVRTGDELEALADQFNRMTAQLRESYAGLERKVEERTQELSNALEKQTAISEILRVISSSPTDVRPVFEIIAERALKLCAAEVSVVSRVESGEVRLAAVQGVTKEGRAALRKIYPVPVGANTVTTRAIRERAVVQVDDVLADPTYYAREAATAARFRGSLCAPMIREGEVIGAIYVGHREPARFTEPQVDLLKTFADQAVIAIENVRLLNETKESLEQQTAISEILQVISGSPGDVKPMLHAVARRALHLCDAAQAGIFLAEGDSLRYSAGYGDMLTPDEDSVHPLKRSLVIGRAVIERQTIHVPDIVPLMDTEYPEARVNQRKYGFRALLAVPLSREDRAIGAIALWRREPRAFSDKQIALVKTFADQAVIAIDNVRLFNETKEALEQQQASAEVLSVIGSSVADTAPVFTRIAESCKRLFDVSAMSINLVGDDGLVHLGYYDGPNGDQLRSVFPGPLDPDSSTGLAILERRVIHHPDVLGGNEVPAYTRKSGEATGIRSVVFAPMIWKERGIGVIVVGREIVQPFTGKEIALLKTFADQAVIAIQNARLFRETREALERQTAMSEILRVISRSPTDVKPVFDTIAAAALGLCDSLSALVFTYDGALIHIAAIANLNPEDEQAWRDEFPRPPSHDTATARAILTGNTAMIPDVLADPEYTISEMAVKTGFRAAMSVPLIRDGRPIGAIGVGRSEPGTFRESEISLLKTFADQAVIAIENVRLFNETNEALQQQTAVAEILRVISSSPTNVQPVLEAIAERAAKLCDAAAASMYMIDDDALRHLASRGSSPDPVTHVDTLPINAETITGRAVLERRTIQVADLLAAGDEYPLSRRIAQGNGHRTVVVTPLLREGQPFGAILLRRNEVRAFNDREIALLRTFGDQAAIALENVRLFNETKEALEQQRASGEVLAAISNSIADTTPVFETILSSCERLFAGNWSVIDVVGEDGLVHLGAYHGPRRDEVQRIYPHAAGSASGTGTAIETRSVVHYPRMDDVAPSVRNAMEAFGIQAAMGAPMIWEGKGIGAIWVGRGYTGPFSEKEIALLRTFADQAVIAIQNARLFHEIDEKSRQLEVANKHKSDFLANMSHELRTPLNAIIGFSEVLLERLFGDLNAKQDDYLKDIHSSGRHLLTLINDILDLSKIEAGRMELEPSRFDVSTAISNALTLVRERAQRHGIALHQHVDPQLGDIVADERKFKQILINLLTNAVKFTPDGGSVDVTAERTERHAEIAVRDTGIGIAAEDQAAVFEEFRQVGRHYTNKQEGTGLGLALTRKFVELHGGTIAVESVPGKGSTFTFTIPLAAEEGGASVTGNPTPGAG